MRWLCVVCLCASVLPATLQLDMDKMLDKDNYGPYKIELKTFEACSDGDDLKTHNKAFYFSTNQVDADVYACNITVTRKKNMAKCVLKITTDVYKPSGKVNIVNYSIRNICQHFAFGEIFMETLNATRNCVVPKGKYVKILNVKEMTRQFWGSKFFYGDYEYHAKFKCGDEVVTCLTTRVVFHKST
ncbi:uncharacterized protein LOC119693748 [Plutella xylostella]|uniref:uncharacterized protein LOC119693748 n=1 Tax=Plutella xylostella TaxID=51655 RepID=UPI0020331761|nr:uncharacterized protein LOC119693748 [Plutella xylostella]